MPANSPAEDSDSPARLNDAQARHAVKLFYDHLPDAVWDDDDKPGSDRMRDVVLTLQQQATAGDQKTLTSLLNSKDQAGLAAQAEIARIVLTQALASPTLSPMARVAIQGAQQVNMGPIMEYGVVIIGMLLATTKIDRDQNGSFHVQLGGNAADILKALDIPGLLEKLPAVLAALPAGILERLV